MRPRLLCRGIRQIHARIPRILLDRGEHLPRLRKVLRAHLLLQQLPEHSHRLAPPRRLLGGQREREVVRRVDVRRIRPQRRGVRIAALVRALRLAVGDAEVAAALARSQGHACSQHYRVHIAGHARACMRLRDLG